MRGLGSCRERISPRLKVTQPNAFAVSFCQKLTITLTLAITKAFFEDQDQMSLTPQARTRLVRDGLISVLDLGKFEPKSLYEMRKTINHGAFPLQTYIGEHSIIRLVTTSHAIRYYQTIDRPIGPDATLR